MLVAHSLKGKYTMSRYEKAVCRLLMLPKDYSYKELKALLPMIGYEEHQSGKTSGSRVTFINKDKTSLNYINRMVVKP